MAQPKQSTSVASGPSLFRVNEAIRDEQMSLLKFFAMVMNAPTSSVEKVTRVSEFMEILSGKHKKKQAAALLQSMLTVIDVKADKVALINSSEEDLKASRELEKFAFGELLVTICKELGDHKFADLKDILQDEISEAPAKIKSPEELLLMLIRANKITPTNLHLLTESLEGIHLNELAEQVREFRQRNNSVAEEKTRPGFDRSSLTTGVSLLPPTEGLVLPRNCKCLKEEDCNCGKNEKDSVAGDSKSADLMQRHLTEMERSRPSNGDIAEQGSLTDETRDTNEQCPVDPEQNEVQRGDEAETLEDHTFIASPVQISDYSQQQIDQVQDEVQHGDETELCKDHTFITSPVQISDYSQQQALAESDDSRRTSYPPYPRHFKSDTDREMKHTPKLKLGIDTEKETPIYSWPVQQPQSLPGFYLMKSSSHGHGVALIINNKNFTDHKVRNGTDRDEHNLIETLRFLGYRVEIRRDCTKLDIERLFNDIDGLVKDKDDSFVCCILSHGSDNIVYGSDSKEVVLRTETNSLEKKLVDNCPRLKGKPKIFFVTTCRKLKKSVAVGTQAGPENDGEDHPRGDFTFNFATLPGEAALRYPDTGTIYMQKLCEVLCKCATKSTLSDMQKEVVKQLSEGKDVQYPALEERMKCNVYFFDDMFKHET